MTEPEGRDAAVVARLAGRVVLVTRAAGQAAATVRAVERRGGRALCLPCLELRFDAEEAARALAALRSGPEVPLLITSSNGVASLRAHASDAELARLLAGRPLFAVGRKSAAALQALGLRDCIVPEVTSQLGMADYWSRHGWPTRLIFVRAAHGRDDLPPLLAAHGCRCSLFACYDSVVPEGAPPSEVLEALDEGRVDAVLLGSGATARGLVSRVGIARARRPVAVAISDRVAREAAELGLRVQVVAPTASFDAMLDALARHLDGATSA
ncbi:MAG: uroporphyrinogen-III synthase [Zetaproteobacteria bacterium]|nr:MAG: uroporphyrinogen-III synthase [Zetaproteobacteria bacterium]